MQCRGVRTAGQSTDSSWRDPGAPSHSLRMTKRVLAAGLWLFSGWYLGAFIAWVLGISALLGPALGITAAILIAGDPRGIIWKRPAREPQLETSPTPA